MSRLNINNLTNENEDGSPKISGISTFSSTHYFVPPSGTTAERPSHADPGMIRFNTDSGHLEYYNGVEWTSVIVNNYQVGISTNPAGTSGGLGTRGLFAGGLTPTVTTNIDYITISTLGTASNFANLNTSRRSASGCSSNIRGLFSGGSNPGQLSSIEFVTFSSTGTVGSFGSLSENKRSHTSCSSSTRGVFAGGLNPTVLTTIEYVTISSEGTISNFGSLSDQRQGLTGCSSPTRGLFAAGYDPAASPNHLNIMEYITISTTGDSIDFGDLTEQRSGNPGSCSSSTRGIFAGGFFSPPSTFYTTIDFVTIATLGNAQEFGDLTNQRYNVASCSSSTRGAFAGGDFPGSSVISSIEYVTIASTGNALDFGDLTETKAGVAACSNGHGGL